MNESFTLGSVIVGGTAFLFLAVVGIISLMKMWQNFKDEEKTCLTQPEIDMLNQGYVFSFVWQIKHLEAIATELGYVFSKIDYIRIVKLIKDDFDPKEGINKDVIKMNMRIYVSTVHEDKQFINPALEI